MKVSCRSLALREREKREGLSVDDDTQQGFEFAFKRVKERKQSVDWRLHISFSRIYLWDRRVKLIPNLL